MKRLNPTTGLPFKKGDVRENGDVFYQYRKIIKSSTDGFYVEYWLKPELFKKHNFTNRSGSSRKIRPLATTMLNHAKGRCYGVPSRIKQGRPATGGVVTIDLKWVVEKLEKGVCEATGDILTMEAKQPNSPSLDRIDPKNPDYTPENARIVTWQFNNMKGAFSDEEFIRVAKQLEITKKRNAAQLSKQDNKNGKHSKKRRTIHASGDRKNSNDAHHHS